MNWTDIAIAVLAIALVVLTVARGISRRRRGNCSCGYCDGCSDKK
ncbi:MAG: FeoB-associated Cys-rich membrane protein [Synergistaceae bacterium]|jgi:hypothetical protein|nr:FeoB-associated Cys-rich membrane protein [Synergistaceae bacterium]